jgi:hypothetical protein
LLDQAAGELHLTAASPAVDAAEGLQHPAEDIDGDSRPQGNGPYAGADEQ